MKKQFQSKSVPRGTRTIWRYLGALFLLFTLGIGQMWGADPTHASPAIVKVANRNFLDLSSTPSNVTVSTDSYSNYGPGYFISNKNADLSKSWWGFSDTFKSSSSSYSNHKDAVGFHAVGSSSSSEFYQILQLREGSGRMVQMDFYVTGTTQIGFQWKNANTSGSKYLEFAIYEMNVSGTTATDGASPVSTIQGSTTSDADQYAASAALDGAKYYHVVVTPHNTSNLNFYGLTFKHAPAATHTVTYKSGDGSGDDVVDDDATVVGGCPSTFSYTGYDFAGWKDGDNNDVEVGDAVTSDMTLTAQWTVHVAKYTVKYMDGTTLLGTEEVNVTEHPAGLAENPKKDCYTFAAWSPALSSVNGEENDEVEVNATWTPIYSSSATLISDANVSAKANVNTIFAASNIVSSITFTSGNYEFTSNVTKPGYYGYKDKASGDYMKILVKQGRRAQVLFGNLGADPTITVNGVAKSLDAARTTGDMAENTFTWTASAEDALISITMGSGTNTLKKVDVIQLYTATRVDGKSDGAGSDANVLETTLPTPTAVSGWTFTGWTANEAVKAGEDTKTAGTVLAAGTYTLLANTTFTAQWAEATATYDVTYVSAHGTAPDAENAASVVLAELSEDGWAHKGWTANADVTVDAATVEAGTLIANGKTVILASNVTFTAVWKEIFTVTFDAKGGSAVDPIDVEDGASIAAAPADPTKDDYIFLGWSETDGGDVVADITAITISDDKTFYAKWKLDVQVSEIVFSNSFKGWIVGSTVTVFYMAGESAPTITSYAGKNLKAEGGVVISGDKIIATGTDDSEVEFDLTMTAVTPLTATGAQTFDGSEGYVKTRHAWTAERKWKMSKHATDGRVARGETSLYIFLDAAESVTLDWGAQKVADDVAVYVNGTFVKNIGKNNNSAIELSNGKNMVALYSLQTSGDIWLNGLTVAPWVSVETVTLKEGEDAISSKSIWESTSFTLTAEVTPDNASNKTITWTSSNEAVATVENGVVTGVAASADPVTITASTVDGVNATCVVTVTTAPQPSADPVITEQPASANYYEGATIAALKVVATGATLSYQWYLGSEAIEGAIADTYQPEVSAIGSYVYHCVVTNTEVGNLPTSLATNNATITIEEDPAAIKLVGATGAINTTDFITGVAAGTVNFDEADHNCAVFGNANITDITSCQYLAGMVQYNARTNKTKVKLDFYSTSGGKKAYLFKMVEGGNVETIEIDMPTAGRYTTEYYTFNSESNRSIYVGVSDRSRVNLLQMKVIDDGATTLKRFGEADYSLNLNKSRLLAPTDATVNFEGMTVTPASHNKVNYSTYLALKSDRDPISFTIAAPVTMTVVNASSNKYYVSTSTTDLGDEYGNGSNDFDLTAGTWYIVPKSTSAVQLTNIAFAAPYCQLAISGQPETNTNFGAGNLTATVVAASTTEGAALAYQWYNASDDSEVVGANEATLTTTTPGEYYVVVTASKAGYQNKVVQSNTIELGYRDLTIATLSALSYGGTAIALEADKYEYRVDLAENTTEVPALAATASMAPYANVQITNATEFVNYEAISTVLVTAEDGVTQKTYTVKFVVDHVYTALVDVTESTTWNWSGSTEATINDVANKGLILANYIDGANFEMIEGKENERARRNQNGGCYQGTQLHFNTTVYGKVKIYFRAPSSGDNCTIYVNNNGKRMNVGNRGNSFGWSKEVIVKGDVVIEMVKDGGGDTRVQQIVFTQVAPDYTREVSNNIGTLCVDHNVLAGGFVGATFYQIASRNEIYNDKIDFEEVGESEELVAGQPYIFQSTTGRIDLFYGATAVTEPVDVRGMYGWFDAAAPIDPTKYDMLDITEENKDDILYISSNKLWSCGDLVDSDLKVVNNRAYIVMSEVPTYAEYQAAQTSNPAPRRRVTLGKDAEQTTTGVDNLNASEQPVKLLINGQLFIIRGEKMFNANGQLVK